jgi:hypothetical protein
MRHGLAIAATMASFIYLECCKGMSDPTWKNDKPMITKQFRRRLSLQMCEYRSYREKNPGCEFLRTTTMQNKKRHGRKRKVSQTQEGTGHFDHNMSNSLVKQLREFRRGFAMMQWGASRVTCSVHSEW